MVKESTYLKENFFVYQRFMADFYILTSAWQKNHKCTFEIDFLPCMCSADLTCVNGSRIQLVLYANCFLGLTDGFLNKKFQEIKLFICHCTFKTRS